jgi:ABC-type transport system substrate-binding protein
MTRSIRWSRWAIKSSAGMNYMYYSDPKVDALVDRAQMTFDEKKRPGTG